VNASRSRALLLLGTAFILGGVIGGVVMMTTGQPERTRRGEGRECAVEPRWVCYWERELTLTAEQKDSLVMVYQLGEGEMNAIRGRIRPAMDSLFQTIRPAVDSQRIAHRERVRSLLTQSQRERYDSIVTAYDEQRRSGRERNSTGPNPRDRNQ
jgi:hypothetical protein